MLSINTKHWNLLLVFRLSGSMFNKFGIVLGTTRLATRKTMSWMPRSLKKWSRCSFITLVMESTIPASYSCCPVLRVTRQVLIYKHAYPSYTHTLTKHSLSAIFLEVPPASKRHLFKFITVSYDQYLLCAIGIVGLARVNWIVPPEQLITRQIKQRFCISQEIFKVLREGCVGVLKITWPMQSVQCHQSFAVEWPEL